MDAHSQELLALPAVRERLAAEAATAPGRALATLLTPSADADEVALRQARTAEALALAARGIGPPHGVADVRGAAGVAERGGMLEIAELGETAATARAAVEVARAVVAQEDDAPLLAGIAGAVDEHALAQLADRLDRALDGHGGLRDDASPDLAAARRALERARREAAETLRRTAAGLAQHLQERFLTERGGRPVLAVRASSRGAVAGIVHDRSASGQTLFIEPLAVLEANNRLREAEAAERAEVERVLGLLSRDVGETAPALVAAVEAMAEVDLAMAAGALSRRWQGCPVEVADEVVLEAARHPLLDPARVVPIDLPLGGLRALVVSGPNAGGKTVALKTLGLLAMLHQCGLRPPARRARLPVFDEILVDIGDEQSIERDLSTFSAHVRTLVAIIAAAGPRSLVLLDEVAAGTDPAEGGALAQAVLERLVAQGALVLATTHHHELKAWASTTPGAANAAVGFDAERLAPTFTLRVGEPGASHALEVAERLELPEEVVAAARRLAGAERAELEDLLRDAAAARVAAEAEREAAAAARAEAAALRRDLERAEAELRVRIERMRAEREAERERARARAEAELAALRAELAGARAEIAAARREEARRAQELRSAELAGARTSERDRRLGAASAALTRAGERLAGMARPAGPPAPLAVGARVVVPELGVRGTVVSVDGDTVEVQGPSARLRLDAARVVPDARIEEPPPPPREARPASVPVASEIDVRGQRAEEARLAVRDRVDAAGVAGLSELRVVHGRGTGALRAAVREELGRHPLVTGIAEPPEEAGGDGVTIAHL